MSQGTNVAVRRYLLDYRLMGNERAADRGATSKLHDLHLERNTTLGLDSPDRP